jgi:amino acid transporter
MFKVGDIINGASESIINSRFWGNPLIISGILMTIVVFVIILFAYGSVEIKEDVNTFTLASKILITMFLSIAGVVMVSFHNIESRSEDKFMFDKSKKMAKDAAVLPDDALMPRNL